MNKLEGVIFDWSGTTVDYGCFASVQAYIDVFRKAGIDVRLEEVRAPMGMCKIDHIRSMLEMPRISNLWERKYLRPATELDVQELYSKLEPALIRSLPKYVDLLPGVKETVSKLRDSGLKIGSTTGYTNKMIGIVAAEARKKGYAPDVIITPEHTSSCGKPYPYMIFKNMESLKIESPWKIVMVGSTIADVNEGLNAGVWTVGIVIGSSLMGMSQEEYGSLSLAEQTAVIRKTEKAYIKSGAHFTIRSMVDLPKLIYRVNNLLSNENMKPNDIGAR